MADAGVDGTRQMGLRPEAVCAAAGAVRDSGTEVMDGTRGLVAALDAASAAAAGLVCGPALAACADLLARRARDLGARTDEVAAGMERAVGALIAADEEVAGRVADAAS